MRVVVPTGGRGGLGHAAALQASSSPSRYKPLGSGDYTLHVTVTHGWWLSPGREEISKPILTPGLKIQPT